MAEDRNEVKDREAFEKNRRKRSIAIALVLAALVAIFYAITVVKIGPDIFNRSL